VWTLGNHDLYVDGEGGQGGEPSLGYRLWPTIREAALHPERHPGLVVNAAYFDHGKLFVHGGILPNIVDLAMRERGAIKFTPWARPVAGRPTPSRSTAPRTKVMTRRFIIKEGKLLSPQVSEQELPPFPLSGCMGCFGCPADVMMICSAVEFTSLSNAFDDFEAFYLGRCQPAGCYGAFASAPCDLSFLESIGAGDPNFRPLLCAKAAGALNPVPTLSQLALASLAVAVLGVGILGLRRRNAG